MTMYKPKEMAEKLGVAVRRLQEWDCNGKLPAYRTPTNRRYFWNQALDTCQKMYAARTIMLSDELKQKLKSSNVSLTSSEKALLEQVPSPCWQAVKKIA